jgi:uncharacterized membrane protein YagU involved in acid resistance
VTGARAPSRYALAQRASFGALSGLAATMAMTAAMQRMHRRLPPKEQYPLPPREIIDRIGSNVSEQKLELATLFAHFGYGAATGAIYAAVWRESKLRSGVGFGLLVWAGSYLFMLPETGVLVPAWRHPVRRNMLMIAAHAVWGAALALGINDLRRSLRGSFGRGPPRDAAP